MKFPAYLAISLVGAIGGSLFLSGIVTYTGFDTAFHGHDSVAQAEAARLPLHVIERFSEKQMEGDGETGSNVKVEEDFVDPENHCEFCTRVEYTPGSSGVAGFAYSSNAAIDLTGAKKIRFWVMGEEGGEKVKFKVAGKKKSPGERDNGDSLGIFNSEVFARTSKEVTLRDDWTNYEVDLERTDLRDITHPFGLELTKGSDDKRQVLYIKGVIFDDEPLRSENALETTAEVPNEEPEMSVMIQTDRTSGDTSTMFRFRASVTGGESPYSFQWLLDGGTEKQTRTFVHSFEEAGTYNLTLTVTDDAGVEVSDSIEIEIDEAGNGEPIQEDAARDGQESESSEPSTNATRLEEQEPQPTPNATTPVDSNLLQLLNKLAK